MTATSTLPAPVADADGAPGIAQRLEQLEAFANQVSGAIDQLVSAVVDVQQAKAGDAMASEIEGLRAKLRELEQQLSLERAGRDLAQVSRMHPKARVAVFVGTTYFGCNVKYAWAAARAQAQALDLEVWFLPYNAEQERLVTALGGLCFPVGHANWTPEHLHTALSAAVVVTTDHFLNPNPYAAALLAGAPPRAAVAWRVDQGDRPAQPGPGARAGPALRQGAGHLRPVCHDAGHRGAG